ncbi:hypothetical protein [Marisediminicola sp. LYQ85]|uniref:hypothetical protein n=2 Tax=unclassified Marisediminicola TaxID=2618316 RepID=UPI0039834FD0
MFTSGLILCAIGGLTFMAMVFWFTEQKKRTGKEFPDRKGVPFSITVGAWLIFAAGGVMAGIANGEIPT